MSHHDVMSTLIAILWCLFSWCKFAIHCAQLINFWKSTGRSYISVCTDTNKPNFLHCIPLHMYLPICSFSMVMNLDLHYISRNLYHFESALLAHISFEVYLKFVWQKIWDITGFKFISSAEIYVPILFAQHGWPCIPHHSGGFCLVFFQNSSWAGKLAYFV